jgi:hypothetical protein
VKRLSRVVLPRGLGSREETSSAGCGTSRAADGWTERERTLISGDRLRKLRAPSGPGRPPGCRVVLSGWMGPAEPCDNSNA